MAIQKDSCKLVATWQSDFDGGLCDYAFTEANYYLHEPSNMIYVEFVDYSVNGQVRGRQFRDAGMNLAQLQEYYKEQLADGAFRMLI